MKSSTLSLFVFLSLNGALSADQLFPFERFIELKEDDVSFAIYTSSDTVGSVVKCHQASALTDLSSFDPTKKTVIYSHGWGETISTGSSVAVKDVWLNVSDYNVLLYNWDSCSMEPRYSVSENCVPDVGKYLGQFLINVSKTFHYPLNKVTLVGHSLGAHVSGIAGRYTGKRVGVILGLDPAGPDYSKSEKWNRLNEDDAQYVQAIHTNTAFLGIDFRVGIADFWPNGGSTQPGCFFDIFIGCSHRRSWQYYVESVARNDFVGRACDSYSDFERGRCDFNRSGRMGGKDVDTSSKGNYYLRTNDEPPYGQGPISDVAVLKGVAVIYVN